MITQAGGVLLICNAYCTTQICAFVFEYWCWNPIGNQDCRDRGYIIIAPNTHDCVSLVFGRLEPISSLKSVFYVNLTLMTVGIFWKMSKKI